MFDDFYAKDYGFSSYDMIFLDHMMPGFDGVETLRRIREIDNGAYQDLPVIALTANTISGAREMFRKPFVSEHFQSRLENSRNSLMAIASRFLFPFHVPISI